MECWNDDDGMMGTDWDGMEHHSIVGGGVGSSESAKK